MHREIIIDTETTGFDPDTGSQIIEILCLELMDKKPTGSVFHTYISPNLCTEITAVKMHGLGARLLSTKPVFGEVVDEFIEYIGHDTPLVSHNIAFDLKFLNWELETVNKDKIDMARCVDTFEWARKLFPGQINGLGNLAERLGVELPEIATGGTMQYCEVVADVYVKLCESY